jgi:hypothetical protein
LTDQKISSALMHIDHILPVARGGLSVEENLWLACARCNTYKGDKSTAIDPISGEQTPLFNPRTQSWQEHFAWSADGTEITGITPVGRATVVALQMNHEAVVYARRLWVSAGWHPPKGE